MAQDIAHPARTRLLALAGSMREASVNHGLLAVTVKMAEARGASVDVAEMRELALPHYDGDLETAEGPPRSVLEFKERIASDDGLLIASPEYNHSIPGVLKNAVDWASRGPERVFKGKSAVCWGRRRGFMARCGACPTRGR